ncbi:MAG TPA: DegT/DnrJ/EryC1/StrS family aminotransferase [Gemmatimonadaceae bacterium]|jgi:dTDP-4-amino-4,6-dideoxygalactose transaminase|nr:DegT/DnrJ/EryC1/StrS family aminotransferase [Gemmatimonadaceae bacterium]
MTMVRISTPPAGVPGAPGDARAGARRWNRVPPAYSPVPPRSLLRVAFESMVHPGRPQVALAGMLAARYGAARAVLLDSGTHALELALRAAMAVSDAPDVVALPAYGCYDLATAAIGARARIALYDVDPATLAPDLASLERALATGVRAVVIAPLHGFPVDWAAVTRIASRAGTLVVEDAAQGSGSTWHGRPAGHHAPLSVLSFARGKGWTGGSGGALLVREPLVDAVDLVSGVVGPSDGSATTLVAAAALSVLSRPSLYAIPAALPWLHLGETRFHEPSPMHGISDAAARLLLATADVAAEEDRTRQRNAAEYLALITATPLVRPLWSPGPGVPGYLRFPVRIRGGMQALPGRDRAEQLGAAPGYPRPLTALTEVAPHLARGLQGERCPGASVLARELVTLPTHSRTTAAGRRELVQILNNYRG